MDDDRTLLDFHDDVLNLIVNHPVLTNEDQANVARTCRRLRKLVIIRHLVFLRYIPPSSKRVEVLADALRGGLVETINVHRDDFGNEYNWIDHLHIHDLSAVGRAFPERVARLKHVCVGATGCWPFTQTASLPASTFTALETIELMGEMTNPIDPGDARYVYDFVTITEGVDHVLSSHSLRTLASAMRGRVCRRLDYWGTLTLENVEDVTGINLRVGRLNIFRARTEIVGALVAMTTVGLGCYVDPGGVISSVAVNHFPIHTMRNMTLMLGEGGVLRALEKRYSNVGNAQLPPLSLTLFTSFIDPPRMDEDDVDALVRLVTRGVIVSLDMKTMGPLRGCVLERMLADAPALKTLKLTVAMEDAWTVCAQTHTNIEELDMCVHASLRLSDQRVLGTKMREWTRLRTVNVRGSLTDRYAAAAAAAAAATVGPLNHHQTFVDALTVTPPPRALRSVTVPGLRWALASETN